MAAQSKFKENDIMNDQLRDILKYMFLTFLSLEILYFIAKGKPNFILVPIVSAVLTVLYAISKLRLVEKIFSPRQPQPYSDGIVNKDKVM